MLTASVGVGGVNRKLDVEQVQERLNRFKQRLEIEPLSVDGNCGPKTRDAIRAFQDDVVGMEVPDGRVDPGERTWQMLDGGPSAVPAPALHVTTGSLATLLTPGPQTALTKGDYMQASSTLGCDIAAIQAVAKVKCSRKAFDDRGRPTILYERHLFHRLTKGRFDRDFTDISNKEAGGYGTFASQYDKLERAYALDEDAALKACSWGMFQILGQNHGAAGFANVVDFVRAMCQTEAEHLKAFVRFILADSTMHQALQSRDWATFARRYNGPQFHKNHYDERMEEAYREAGGH